MIKIPITEKMRQWAMAKEDQILKTSTLKFTDNYTHFEKEHRYYYGFLGEVVFWRYLVENGVKYDFAPKTDGYSDKGDFFVYVNGVMQDIDVKTQTNPKADKLLVNVAQYMKSPHKFYVAIRLGEAELDATIMGFCLYADLTEDKSKYLLSPAMSIKYEDMGAIDDFIYMLDRANVLPEIQQ